MPARKALARIVPLLGGQEPPSLPAALCGEEFVLVEVDVGRFWVPAADEVMRPYLQRHQSWEEGLASLLRRLLRPRTRFLDVGAALGYFSVFAARAVPAVTVDSVEPNPATLDLLRFNLWLNDVRAQVWPVALSSQRSSLPLMASATNLGDVWTRPHDKGTTYSAVVAALPADELFPDRSFDLVKIDVQGWELEVLLGMQRIIRDSPGITMLLEFWPAALRERDQEPATVLEAYRRLGLEVVVARDSALERLPDGDVIAMCDSAGPNGQVNLVLRRT